MWFLDYLYLFISKQNNKNRTTTYKTKAVLLLYTLNLKLQHYNYSCLLLFLSKKNNYSNFVYILTHTTFHIQTMYLQRATFLASKSNYYLGTLN